MLSTIFSWNSVVVKLGFVRRRRTNRSRSRHARRLRCEPMEDRRMLALLTVNSLADTQINMDGVLTLREAVEVVQQGNTNGLDSTTIANQISGNLGDNDTIEFSNGGTITLNLNLGQISFSKALTIDATDAPSAITVNGNDPTPAHTGQGIRIFNITDATGGTAPPLVTLIGLTLKGADVGGFPGQGGAIRSEARLVLRDCTIKQNQADRGGAVFVEVAGGGATPRSVLTIEDCLIENNEAFNGAGVVIVSGNSGANSDTMTISRTTIRHNTILSSGNGGGVQLELTGGGTFGPQVTIADSTITLNQQASRGGGVHAILNNGAKLVVSGTTFEEHNVSDRGAGLYAELSAASLDIDESTFSLGVAANKGGGIHVVIHSSSSVTITESEIRDNRADNSGAGGFDSSGGGGGGVFALIEENASLTLADSIVSGNIAQDGGGIFANMSYPYLFGHRQSSGSVLTIERSRLEGNRAVNRGGGLYAATGGGGSISVVDSVITGNDAGIALLGGFPAQIPNAGGGIYAYLFSNDESAAAMLTVAGTEISSNTAGQHGGGIALCTKRENAAAEISRLSVYNSTISGNVAGHTTQSYYPGTGGGVHLAIYPGEPEEALDGRFQNVTITNNTADQGGGVWSFVPSLQDSRNDVRLTNSIASANKKHSGQASNLWGSFNIPLTTFNIIGAGDTDFSAITTWTHDTHVQTALRNQLGGDSDSGNKFTNDPKLNPLASNGGLTRTHRLMSDSQAIDAGSNALAVVPFTSTVLTTDQREVGFPRPFDIASVPNDPGRTVDIGAYEAGRAVICVAVFNDEFDGFDLSYGDLSLREAVDYANTAWEAITICLPAGEYYLSIGGGGGASQGDLDITGNVTIIGDGPGLSIINGAGLTYRRIFDVANLGTLNLSRVTVALGHGMSTSDERNGNGIRVQNGGELHMDNSAVVGNETGGWGLGGGIYFAATAHGSIESSVITVNYADQQTGGLYLADSAGTGGTVTIESTIIANNWDGEGTDYPDIYVGANRTLSSGGYNRVTTAPDGPGTIIWDIDSDYIGPVDYVVTSIADTYDGDADPVNMSLRDAIHQANITAGPQEIWLPAWEFRLTREGTDAGAPNVSIGDLDVTESLTIRGIDLATKVDATAIVDAAFDQIGGAVLTLDEVTVIN